MDINLHQAHAAITRCFALRNKGVVEAVLRGEFQSWLRLIFPSTEDGRWINHYSEGAEERAVVGIADGELANRFIDNLVGSTTIEFESDLRVRAKKAEGLEQVKQHAAGLIRRGVPSSQVRGILSDTVEWYVYDVCLASNVEPDSCTVNDIELIQIDSFEGLAEESQVAERFTVFLRKHLAREKSRPLIASNLAFDLGLESQAYRRHVKTLTELVNSGRIRDSSIELATELWSQFVDHLEGVGGSFRVSAYVDELYLTILARILSANVLRSSALISDDNELRSILNGSFFQDNYQLNNLIEKDYFGWITEPAHIIEFIPVARELQRDLYAYNFSLAVEEDLFGRLMAQLARRSQRKLLGQEWTPSWLARHLAEYCLTSLPHGEEPELIDMCCGSGAILVEVIKAAKALYGYDDIAQLGKVVTGIDVDPLAVAFAKTTWVTALAAEINRANGPVTIPIYHADSLFAITPISSSLPMLGKNEEISITLDGETLKLPLGLLQSQYRELFDALIDWAYDEAQQSESTPPTKDDALTTLDEAAIASGVTLTEGLRENAAQAILVLAKRMKELADAGRNGIWAFILRNTYRPGLLAGKFNGLVSNPPWLTMSALSNNPYRESLSRRAALYGVLPTGASFLHLELSTIHLLHAIDRYLKPDAAIACLVPSTILNGSHHEMFRQQRYAESKRPVAFNICEVWQINPSTFKYPAVALNGKKGTNIYLSKQQDYKGAVARPDGIEKVDFFIRKINQNRTAWVLEKSGLPALSAGSTETPQQGADLMPRSAICIEILNCTGNEFRVDTPNKDSKWGFTIKQAKLLKDEKFPGYVAPRFIHRIAQSENLLPFILGPHRAPIAIPACREDKKGRWRIYESTDIRRMGFTQTSRRFRRIDERLVAISDSSTKLATRIDFRHKLSAQNFGDKGFVILTGAGGQYICAACLPVAEAAALVIDQTLYWLVVIDEDEAWFKTGFLNSMALTEAILPFNPKGSFGPRHIHTLPFHLMPKYNAKNDDHQAIATAARSVANKAFDIVINDNYINDPNQALSFRRRRLREELNKLDCFRKLDKLCGKILGIESVLADE